MSEQAWPPGFVRPKPGRPKAREETTLQLPEASKSERHTTRPEGVLSVKQVAFLAAYVECGGNFTEAAKLTGVHRSNHQHWIKQPAYEEAFADAHAKACEKIEHEIYRRGELGYEEPIVYQGKISKDENGKPLTVRKYSDTLLIFRAKKFMPEYRDKQSIEHSGEINNNVSVVVVEDEHWYGNDAHKKARIATAESAPVSSASVVIAGEVQGLGVRPAVGQVGSGAASDNEGPRTG